MIDAGCPLLAPKPKSLKEGLKTGELMKVARGRVQRAFWTQGATVSRQCFQIAPFLKPALKPRAFCHDAPLQEAVLSLGLKDLITFFFRGPQMGGQIRRGRIWRFWGAPLFSPEVPKYLFLKGLGPLDGKSGRPKNAKFNHDGSDPPFVAL